MKMFLLLMLLPMQIFAQNYTVAAGSKVDQMAFGVQNFIRNPSCQKGLSFTYSSIGAPVMTKSTTVKVDTATGTSCLIDANASAQIYTFLADKIPLELKGGNCQATITHTGGSSLYKAYVRINSVKVATLDTLSDSSVYVRTDILTFPCGDDTTNQVDINIESTSASALALNIAKVSVGANTNIGTVAQSKTRVQAIRNSTNQAIGSAAYTTILYNDESSTANLFDKFNEFDTTTGVFTAKEAMNAKISCGAYAGSIPTGEGFQIRAYKNNAVEVCKSFIVAGFTTDQVPGPSSCSVPMVAGDTLVCQIQSGGDTSYNVIASFGTIITIDSLPANSQEVMSLNAQDYSFAAYRGANQTGVNPNASFVKMNFNSVAAPGFNPSGAFDTAAFRYNVKVSGPHAFEASLSITSTNVLNAVYVPVFYVNGSFAKGGSSNPAVTASVGVVRTVSSGILNLIAGDYVEVYLYGAGNNSASQLTLNADTTSTWFSGGPTRAVVQAPIVVNGVISSYQGVMRNESALVVTGPSFAVASQNGTWLTATSSAGAGKALFTFSSAFPTTPSCTCSASLGGASFCAASPTTTNVTIWTYSSTPALSNEAGVSLICIGPR